MIKTAVQSCLSGRDSRWRRIQCCWPRCRCFHCVAVALLLLGYSCCRGPLVVVALLSSWRSCCRSSVTVVVEIMRIGHQLLQMIVGTDIVIRIALQSLHAVLYISAFVDKGVSDLRGSINLAWLRSPCILSAVISVPRPHNSPNEVLMRVAVQITSAQLLVGSEPQEYLADICMT